MNEPNNQNEQIYKFKIIPQAEVYYNEDSCWGVYNFTTQDDIPEFYGFVGDNPFSDELFVNKKLPKVSAIVGNMQRLYIGNEYNCTATLIYNSKYNKWQYKPITINSDIPKSLEQQKVFLKTLLNEKQVETILSVYPNIVEELTKGTAQVDLSKLKGIGEKTWTKIKNRVVDNYVISDILILLQPLGITYKMISKLLMSEQNPALLKQKLLDNPYIMTKIKGLGFKKVDDLALKLNTALRISDKRTYAFLKFYFNNQGNTYGHTWNYVYEVENAVRDNIGECLDIFKKIIENCVENNNNTFLYYNNDRLGLRKTYNIEKNIIDILVGQKEYYNSLNKKIDIQNSIQQTEKELSFQLTEEQKHIVEQSLNNNVIFISGKAGCGKSTISRAILNAYKQAGYSVSACALSAKAAQRITEATGFKATTIHKLLGLTPDSNGNINQIETDVLFVDECSMINIELFEELLSATKDGVRLIFVGDNMQLPPIGFGNPFSDLLKMKDKFAVY